MKITEVTAESRRTINRMKDLYMKYILDPALYGELLNLVENNLSSTNANVAKNASFYRDKLLEDFLQLLTTQP